MLPFWNKVKDNFHLTDSYIAVNSTTRRYSFFTNNYKSKNRIDRIYIPSETANKVLGTNFVETSWGGHRIFCIQFSSNIQWRPGQWCLNTDLPKDLNYVNYIKDNQEEFREYRKDFENAGCCKAYGEITYCFLFNTEKKKQVERKLKKALMIEKENIENLLEIKKRIKDIEDKKAEGQRIGARIAKFKETEPSITYYAKLEKSKSEKFLSSSL